MFNVAVGSPKPPKGNRITDGTHDLDLMDTDLETDYGADYLEAKSKVDELIVK